MRYVLSNDNLQQVDENYDPTDFLQGLVPGEAPSFQPPPMVMIPSMDVSFILLTGTNELQVMDDGTIIKPEPGAMADDHLQVMANNLNLNLFLFSKIQPLSRTTWLLAMTARTRTRCKDIKQSRSPLMRTTQWLSEGTSMKNEEYLNDDCASVSIKLARVLE